MKLKNENTLLRTEKGSAELIIDLRTQIKGLNQRIFEL